MISITPGLRQSAILLHSLSEKDRKWLLNNMEASQREKLTALLQELREIGIPSDEKLIQEIFQETAFSTDVVVSNAHVEISSEEAAIKVLAESDAEVMFVVLGKQPSIFIAKFLSIHSWDWKADFIALLDEQKMRSVFKMLALPVHVNLTERAKNELIQIVCASVLKVSANFPKKNAHRVEHNKIGILHGVKRLLPRPLAQWFGDAKSFQLQSSTVFQRLPGA